MQSPTTASKNHQLWLTVSSSQKITALILGEENLKKTKISEMGRRELGSVLQKGSLAICPNISYLQPDSRN